MIVFMHTFMFADLTGYTDYTLRHGDEPAAELAVSFHRRVRELAGEHGCAVIKTIGDAVMVRCDDAPAAMRLALDIHQLRDEGYPPVRIGLDTGPAVERAGDWWGLTVNTAARVAATAKGGQLLVTERTRAAVQGSADVHLSDHGQAVLKGLGAAPLFAAAAA